MEHYEEAGAADSIAAFRRPMGRGDHPPPSRESTIDPSPPFTVCAISTFPRRKL